MKIYLSGPMSGRPAFNRPAFQDAADHLRLLDVDVVNPAELPDGMEWIEYLTIGLESLRECQVVVTLDGWATSTGAQIEVKVAQKLGLPVVTLEDFARILAASYDYATPMTVVCGADTEDDKVA